MIKSNKYYFSFLILFCFCLSNLYAQFAKDTTRVHELVSHVKKIYNDDPKTALKEINEAANISLKNNFKRGIILSLNTKGRLLRHLGEYDSSLICYKKALTFCDTTKDWYNLSSIYNNMGNVYLKKGNSAMGLMYFQKSLDVSKGKVDEIENAPTENNIGLIYMEMLQYPRALKYFSNALETFKKAGDNIGAAGSYSNMGGIYYYQGEYNKAVGYFKLALNAYQQAGDSGGVSIACTNIADVSSELKNYDEAEFYLKRAYKLAEKTEDVQSMVYALLGMANAATGKANYERAEEYIKKSMELSEKTNSITNKHSSFLQLAQTLYKGGKYKEAYANLYTAYSLRDTIHKQDAAKQLAEINAKYEDAEKNKKIELLQKEKQITLLNQEELDRKHKVTLYSLIAAVVVGLLIASLMYSRFKTKQKANLLLEEKNKNIEQQKALIENKNAELGEKNKEITDGIHYAKRIQMALLTSEKYIAKHLANFFVLYKPKDIVSGDFYWALKTDTHFYFTVADCTGHGVPGAFMSMIGINLLNDIISERKVSNPSLVLDIMREEVIRNLNSEDSEVESKDGMDMVLCKLDLQTRELEFSAANNSLYIYHAEEKELKEYKGDKMPVGKYTEKFDSFTRQKIQLKENDLLYAFTDGYPDQFGGPKGKKYKYKQLEENIHSILHLPMNEQKQHLNSSFENWKGQLEQIDDVCIMCVKV